VGPTENYRLTNATRISYPPLSTHHNFQTHESRTFKCLTKKEFNCLYKSALLFELSGFGCCVG
jgi:hypothetical protein